jgi:hypothetical protein
MPTGRLGSVLDVLAGAAVGSDRRRFLRRPARSFDLHQRLTTMLVCAVATVVFTRALLAATGYPQVGNSTLHIAHVLWGGLLLTGSLIATLAFLSPATKPIASVAGGIGFGLFIDEVGKFVTRDVNYFYRPAIAIIYVSFLVLFGVVRWLSRRGFSAEEATLIGLDALQRAAVGALGDDRRARVLALIHATGAHDDLAQAVTSLLDSAATAPQGEASLTHRLSSSASRLWGRLSRHRLFRRAVFAVLLAAAAVSGIEDGWLLRHGVSHLPFSERAFTLTTAVADLMLALGALRLSRSLLSALRWYDHAVLLEITVAQVFLYGSEQLAATLNLTVLLVVWGLLRWTIEFESGAQARLALGRSEPHPT